MPYVEGLDDEDDMGELDTAVAGDDADPYRDRFASSIEDGGWDGLFARLPHEAYLEQQSLCGG